MIEIFGVRHDDYGVPGFQEATLKLDYDPSVVFIEDAGLMPGELERNVLLPNSFIAGVAERFPGSRINSIDGRLYGDTVEIVARRGAYRSSLDTIRQAYESLLEGVDVVSYRAVEDAFDDLSNIDRHREQTMADQISGATTVDGSFAVVVGASHALGIASELKEELERDDVVVNFAIPAQLQGVRFLDNLLIKGGGVGRLKALVATFALENLFHTAQNFGAMVPPSLTNISVYDAVFAQEVYQRTLITAQNTGALDIIDFADIAEQVADEKIASF